MRIKLILLTLLVTALSGLAATGVRGTLVDAKTGAPVGNANVLISDQGIFVTSSSDGTFVISNAQTGRDVLEVIASGYNDSYTDIDIVDGIDTGADDGTPEDASRRAELKAALQAIKF